MTKAETLAAIRALPNMTARYISDTGEYRVTMTNVSRERAEAIACYTDDAEDALGTARDMAARAAAQA